MAYIEFDRVVKEYPSGRTTIRALDEASFTADRGELTQNRTKRHDIDR